MANLGSLSRLRESERGLAALASALLTSPVLRFLDQNSAFEEDATDFDFRAILGSLAVQTRNIGGSYNNNVSLAPGDKITSGLAAHGFSLDIDISHLEDAERGLRDLNIWLDKALPAEVKMFVRGFEALLFNGSGAGNPKQILGLMNLLNGVDVLPGFDITGVIDAAAFSMTEDAVSFDLSDPDNDDAFVEMIQLGLAQVENPTGIVLPRPLKVRATTIARRQRINGQAPDQFGKMQETFDGVPMIPALDTTILQDESDNTPVTPLENTTSLYIMAPAEQALSLVTNSGLDWMDYNHVENKESGRTKGEIRAQWKVQEKNSIRRIRNIKL